MLIYPLILGNVCNKVVREKGYYLPWNHLSFKWSLLQLKPVNPFADQ